MQWNDNAIILSVRKHGENSAVVRMLASEHGVYAGVVKGVTSKSNRGIFQPGNVVNATWNARLSEQLGMFKTELMTPHAAHLMQDPAKLAALTSACAMVEIALPERHPYPRLYALFLQFLADMHESDRWMENYISLELDLLAEAGFGLDLTQCAATGRTDELIYVSPKSGRAVCREAGEPYKEKMLPLPGFLLTPPPLRGRVGVGGDSPSSYDESLLGKAKALRKNLTEAEKKLWDTLRSKQMEQFKFRRQQPIGNYIVDFFCSELRLVVELDGGQHAEQMGYDEKRTQFLQSQGYHVLRFWNNEVMGNIEGVYGVIVDTIKGSIAGVAPHLTLPLKGGGLISTQGKSQEILAGLRLSGYFLAHWLLEPHNRKLPPARARLVQILKEHYGAETKVA